MTTVSFVGTSRAVTVEATPGERLLDIAQAAGQPLEGTCGGEIACATCHVRIDPDDLARLPPPTAEEEDLLDLVPGAGRTSRLACQIWLPRDLPMLTVRVAA